MGAVPMLTVLQAQGHLQATPDGAGKETVEAQEARLVATYERALRSVASNPTLAQAELAHLLQDPAFTDALNDDQPSVLRPIKLLAAALADAAKQGTTITKQRKPALVQLYTLALRNLAYLLSDKEPSSAAWLYSTAALQQPEKADAVLWGRLGKVAAQAGLLGLSRYALEQGLKKSARSEPLLERCMEVSWVIGDRLGAAGFAARLLRLDPYHPQAKTVQRAVQAQEAGSPAQPEELEYEEYLGEHGWVPPLPATVPQSCSQLPPVYVLALPVDSDLAWLLHMLVQLLTAQLPACTDLQVVQQLPSAGNRDLGNPQHNAEQTKTDGLPVVVALTRPEEPGSGSASAAAGQKLAVTSVQHGAATVRALERSYTSSTIATTDPTLVHVVSQATGVAGLVNPAGSQPQQPTGSDSAAAVEGNGSETGMHQHAGDMTMTEQVQLTQDAAQQQPPFRGSRNDTPPQPLRHLLSLLQGHVGQPADGQRCQSFSLAPAPQDWELTLSQPVLLCVTPLQSTAPAANAAAGAPAATLSQSSQQQSLLVSSSQASVLAGHLTQLSQPSQLAPATQPLSCGADMPLPQVSQPQGNGKVTGMAAPAVHAGTTAEQHDDKENQQQEQHADDGAALGSEHEAHPVPLVRSPGTRKRRPLAAPEDKERAVRQRGSGAGTKGGRGWEGAGAGAGEEPALRGNAVARQTASMGAVFHDLRNLLPCLPGWPAPATDQADVVKAQQEQLQKDAVNNAGAAVGGAVTSDSKYKAVTAAFKTVCDGLQAVIWTDTQLTSPVLLPTVLVDTSTQQQQAQQPGHTDPDVRHPGEQHGSGTQHTRLHHTTLRQLCTLLIQRLLSHPHLLTPAIIPSVLQLHLLLQPQTQPLGSLEAGGDQGLPLSATQGLQLAELYVAYVWHEQQSSLRTQAFAQQQVHRQSGRASKPRNSKTAAAVDPTLESTHAGAGAMELQLQPAECLNMAAKLLGLAQASWVANLMLLAPHTVSFPHSSPTSEETGMEWEANANLGPEQDICSSIDASKASDQQGNSGRRQFDAGDADQSSSWHKAQTLWVLAHLAECQEQASHAVQLYRACWAALASLPEGAPGVASSQCLPAGLGACTLQAIAQKLETLHIYAVVDAAEAHLHAAQQQHARSTQLPQDKREASGVQGTRQGNTEQPTPELEQLSALLDLAFGPLPKPPSKGTAETMAQIGTEDETSSEAVRTAMEMPSEKDGNEDVSAVAPCTIDHSLVPTSLRTRAVKVLHQLSGSMPHSALLLAIHTSTLLAQSQAQLAAALEAAQRPMPAAAAGMTGDAAPGSTATNTTTAQQPTAAMQLAELLHAVSCVEGVHRHMMSPDVWQLFCTAAVQPHVVEHAVSEPQVEAAMRQLHLPFILCQQVSAFSQELLAYLQRLHALVPIAAAPDSKQAAGSAKDAAKDAVPAVTTVAQGTAAAAPATQAAATTTAAGAQKPPRPTIAMRSHAALSTCAKLLLQLQQYLSQAAPSGTALLIPPTTSNATAEHAPASLDEADHQLPVQLQHMEGSLALWSRLLELLGNKLSASEMQAWLHYSGQALQQYMHTLHSVVGGPDAAADILFDEDDSHSEEDTSGDGEDEQLQATGSIAGAAMDSKATTSAPGSVATGQAGVGGRTVGLDHDSSTQTKATGAPREVPQAVSELLRSVYGALGRLLHLRAGIKLDWSDDTFGNVHGSSRLVPQSLDVSGPAQVLEMWELLQPLYHVLHRDNQPTKLRPLLEKLVRQMPAVSVDVLHSSKAYKYLEDPTLCDRDLALGHVQPPVLEPCDSSSMEPNKDTQQGGAGNGTPLVATQGGTAAGPMDVDSTAAGGILKPGPSTAAAAAGQGAVDAGAEGAAAVPMDTAGTMDAAGTPAVVINGDTRQQASEHNMHTTEGESRWTAVRQGLYHLLIQASEPADSVSNYSTDAASHAEVERAAQVLLCDLMWSPTRASTWEHMAELYCSACRCLLDAAASEMSPTDWVSESNGPIRARLAQYMRWAIRAVAVCIAMAVKASNGSADTGTATAPMEVDATVAAASDRSGSMPHAALDADQMGMLYGSLGQIYLDKIMGCTPVYDSLPPSHKPARDTEWLADVATGYVLMERAGQHLGGEWTYACQMAKLLGKLNAAWPAAVEAVRNQRPAPQAAVQALWKPVIPALQKQLTPPGSQAASGSRHAQPDSTAVGAAHDTQAQKPAEQPAVQQQGDVQQAAATGIQSQAGGVADDVERHAPVSMDWVADMLKCYVQACQLALSNDGGAVIQPWYSLHAARLKLVHWAQELLRPHVSTPPVTAAEPQCTAGPTDCPSSAHVETAHAGSGGLAAGTAAMERERPVSARQAPCAAMAMEQARQLARHVAEYCFLPESSTLVRQDEYAKVLLEPCHSAPADHTPNSAPCCSAGATPQPEPAYPTNVQHLQRCLDMLLNDCLEAMAWCDSSYKAVSSASSIYHRARYQIAKARWWQQQPAAVLEALKGMVGPSMAGKKMVPFTINVIGVTSKMTKAVSKRKRRRSTHHAGNSLSSLAAAALRPSHVVGIGDDEELRDCTAAVRRCLKLYLRAAVTSYNVDALASAAGYLMGKPDKTKIWQVPMQDLMPVAQGLYHSVLLQRLGGVLQRSQAAGAAQELPVLSEGDKYCLLKAQALYAKHVVDVLPGTLGSGSATGGTDGLLQGLLSQLGPASLMSSAAQQVPVLSEKQMAQLVLLRIQALAVSHELEPLLKLAAHIRKKLKTASKLGPQPSHSLVVILNPLVSHLVTETAQLFKQAVKVFIEQHERHEAHLKEVDTQRIASATVQAGSAAQQQASHEPEVRAPSQAAAAMVAAMQAAADMDTLGVAQPEQQEQQDREEQLQQGAMDVDNVQAAAPAHVGAAALNVQAAAPANPAAGCGVQTDVDTDAAMDGSGDSSSDDVDAPASPRAMQAVANSQDSPLAGLRKTRVTRKIVANIAQAAVAGGLNSEAAKPVAEPSITSPAVMDLPTNLKAALSMLQSTLAVHPWQLCTSSSVQKDIEDRLVKAWLDFKLQVLRAPAGVCCHWAALQSVLATTTSLKVRDLSKTCDSVISRLQAELGRVGDADVTLLDQLSKEDILNAAEQTAAQLQGTLAQPALRQGVHVSQPVQQQQQLPQRQPQQQLLQQQQQQQPATSHHPGIASTASALPGMALTAQQLQLLQAMVLSGQKRMAVQQPPQQPTLVMPAPGHPDFFQQAAGTSKPSGMRQSPGLLPGARQHPPSPGIGNATSSHRQSMASPIVSVRASGKTLPAAVARGSGAAPAPGAAAGASPTAATAAAATASPAAREEAQAHDKASRVLQRALTVLQQGTAWQDVAADVFSAGNSQLLAMAVIDANQRAVQYLLCPELPASQELKVMAQSTITARDSPGQLTRQDLQNLLRLHMELQRQSPVKSETPSRPQSGSGSGIAKAAPSTAGVALAAVQGTPTRRAATASPPAASALTAHATAMQGNIQVCHERISHPTAAASAAAAAVPGVRHAVASAPQPSPVPTALSALLDTLTCKLASDQSKRQIAASLLGGNLQQEFVLLLEDLLCKHCTQLLLLMQGKTQAASEQIKQQIHLYARAHAQPDKKLHVEDVVQLLCLLEVLQQAGQMQQQGSVGGGRDGNGQADPSTAGVAAGPLPAPILSHTRAVSTEHSGLATMQASALRSEQAHQSVQHAAAAVALDGQSQAGPAFMTPASVTGHWRAAHPSVFTTAPGLQPTSGLQPVALTAQQQSTGLPHQASTATPQMQAVPKPTPPVQPPPPVAAALVPAAAALPPTAFLQLMGSLNAAVDPTLCAVMMQHVQQAAVQQQQQQQQQQMHMQARSQPMAQPAGTFSEPGAAVQRFPSGVQQLSSVAHSSGSPQARLPAQLPIPILARKPDRSTGARTGQ